MSAWPVTRGGARGGRRAPQPQGAAAAAGPRRPLGRHEVRPRRRAQRARARLGARDLARASPSARSPRDCWRCSASRVFGRVLAVGDVGGGAGRRRRGGLRPRARERDRLLGSRGREAHARGHRRRGGRPRHARRHHRDPRLRLPARARLAHRAAAAPRRAPGRRGRRHPGHEGRRDRRRVRQRRACPARPCTTSCSTTTRAATGARATAPAASRAACRTASRSSCAWR